MPTRGQPREKTRRDEEEAPRKTARALDPREVQRIEAERRAQREARAKVEGSDGDEGSEGSWEDVSDEEDNDDNFVDERYEDMEDDEVIDEGSDAEAEEGDAAYEGLQAEVGEALRRVKFGELPADDDDEEAGEDARVFRTDRGDALEEGQQLAYSNKAYDSFFQLRTEYPCLSFDIVRDNLGAGRTAYPLTMFFVCGTQADEQNKNELFILKVSNICRTKHDQDSDDSEDEFIGDNNESDEDAEEGDEVNGGEPIVNFRTIKHFGTANRVRCSPHLTSLCAVWSDAGHVQVFDIDSEYRTLADFANYSKEQAQAWANPDKKPAAPLKFCSSSSTHRTEGYGIDWSPVSDNTFATGDCNGDIFVWKPSQGGRWAPLGSSVGTGMPSVEEIRWSAVQPDVFIASRAGGTCQVWDTRDMRKQQIMWQADPTDINVADWNKSRPASHLFVTGADSGNVAVWDLRRVAKGETTPIQQLSFHRGRPITSIEFSTHNESVLALTCDDGQCTLWDLSLERDADEEREVVGQLFERQDISQLPDQLMFQHMGLEHPKEVHFHSQIPGMTVTTDFLGLHLFKPMNWRDLMK